MEKIKIKTEYIKLDQLLKWCGKADSGTDAKEMIKRGIIKVNGNKEFQRGKKIYPGDQVEIVSEECQKFLIE
jgi:ribosome-associated protein